MDFPSSSEIQYYDTPLPSGQRCFVTSQRVLQVGPGAAMSYPLANLLNAYAQREQGFLGPPCVFLVSTALFMTAGSDIKIACYTLSIAQELAQSINNAIAQARK